MAVNGVEIKVGQVWRTKDGKELKVATRTSWPPDYPWSLTSANNRQHYCFSDGGVSQVDIGFQLHELINDLPIEMLDDPNTKQSNPKEAIGDKKVPLWLCSPIAEAHWSAAQFAGLMKYGAWNWRAAGVRTSTYISAIKRHTARWENGERLDPVDGTHHLGNIMACCAIQLEAEYLGKLNDDRPPSADLQKTFEEVEGMIARLREMYADKKPKHWTIDDKV